MGDDEEPRDAQLRFFDHPGPIHSVIISPSSSVIAVGGDKKLKAVSRDKSRRAIDTGILYKWIIAEGVGSLEGADTEFATFHSGQEPGISQIRVFAREGDEVRQAEGIVTVAAQLIPHADGGSASRKGLPGYTFKRAPGELWRSRYDLERELIVINNAHADFIFASRQGTSKLRYIMRLYAKELVLANFPEADKAELLERAIELGLYAEDKL